VRLAAFFLGNRSDVARVEGQATAGAHGEESAASRELRIRETFGEEEGTAVVVEVLQEGHRLDSAIAGVVVAGAGFVEDVTAEGISPGGDSRSAVTQDKAAGAGIAGGASLLAELFRRGRRSVEAQLLKPGLVVVHDFHRAVRREAQALVVEAWVHALIEEGRVEVVAILFAQPPDRVAQVRLQVYQGVVELVESLVVL